MSAEQGERDLAVLLAGLSPQLLGQEYVFCTVADGAPGDYLQLDPLATFREQEGLTLVLERGIAAGAGFPVDAPMSCITLQVHSSLAAVGLTAAVSGALAQAGISANVVAAWYHDHVFVPAGRAQEALDCLRNLVP
ncbi:MAG: ACT domain-containing protein [Halioglobus sp.]|nr:ACT domain-containing protein [Halioglobus sp.]